MQGQKWALGRIIGGWEAKPHSRPYMAYLLIGSESGRSQCGGFLLRPNAVLSAAHCVARKTKVNITVTLGAHNISKKEPSQQVFHIRHWVIHPSYSGDTLENDIMLLKSWGSCALTCLTPPTPFTSQGDSGGPLVCNGKAQGIVSYGPKYGIFPKVFTRVSYFEPWIREELRKFALQDLPDSPSSD
ncbi:PREDICTED: cathepsin G-like [Pygoscelis adeliae]|uniref:cathepsin G-like n=1 Tax=Pygoscelis adeliae TaxID=9238 RepID=UPI0004F4FE80|nr:PREDICTED: cathepsin G-like [Pygoscelis adeliae]